LKKLKTSSPGVAGRSAILGAAFLMATSAIGPGFLTQTSVFTQELFTSFGFVILISILLDLGAQLNVWRIVTMSESRARRIFEPIVAWFGFFSLH
jgi:Mn2+/Fe2+ NRAMP family transporter